MEEYEKPKGKPKGKPTDFIQEVLTPIAGFIAVAFIAHLLGFGKLVVDMVSMTTILSLIVFLYMKFKQGW